MRRAPSKTKPSPDSSKPVKLYSQGNAKIPPIPKNRTPTRPAPRRAAASPFEAGSYPESWQYPKHYSPDEVNYLLPEPPAPYKTWDGMTAAVKTRKE